MGQYRKKPVTVRAMQFFYDGARVPGVFYPPVSEDGKTYEGDAFVVTIHNQRAYLQNGDWVITEPDGEHHYPCKPDIFSATYEPVSAQSDMIAAVSEWVETYTDVAINSMEHHELLEALRAQPQPLPDSIKDDIGLCAAAMVLAYHRKTHDHILQDDDTFKAAMRVEHWLGRR